MTIDQMIEVLNAYKRGEKIEFYNTNENKWIKTDLPLFNFANYSYRIAKQKKTIKLEAWLTSDGQLTFLIEDFAYSKTKWTRIPEEDKEITLP